jgi:hypothetical protein
MALYGQYDWRSRSKGTSLSSLALLAVFVAAAGLMVALVFWRPGFGGGTTATPVAQEASAQTADSQAADAGAGAASAADAPAGPAAAPEEGSSGP